MYAVSLVCAIIILSLPITILRNLKTIIKKSKNYNNSLRAIKTEP